MVDAWVLLQAGGKRKKARLIEVDGGRLLAFQANNVVDEYETESIDVRRRTATTTDGEQLRWTPTCSSCSQPRQLRVAKAELLASYEADQ